MNHVEVTAEDRKVVFRETVNTPDGVVTIERRLSPDAALAFASRISATAFAAQSARPPAKPVVLAVKG
jgi:hypothetical protein